MLKFALVHPEEAQNVPWGKDAIRQFQKIAESFAPNVSSFVFILRNFQAFFQNNPKAQ